MLDVSFRNADGQTVLDLTRRAAPALPVADALSGLLPHGLRRGSTVAVSGSVSLLLALLGASSHSGAWCALVGMPAISAEAAHEYGIALPRLAIIPTGATSAASWTTAVGALLDAVDLVAARVPSRIVPGDIRRLSARARTHDSVLIPYLVGSDVWPGADVRLSVLDTEWSGLGDGYGRLVRRRMTVGVDGRGQASRARSRSLWLPAAGGGLDGVDHPVVELPARFAPPLPARAG